MQKPNQKQRVFSYSEGIYSYIEKIFDGIALSILWIVFCCPIFTIGASTTAFYYTTVKVMRKDRGYLFSEFWKAFKLNFKNATLLWIMIGTIIFILQLNIGIAPEIDKGYFGIFLICFYVFLILFVVLVAAYGFPALSRFNMNVGWILKLSIYMTVRYLPTSSVLLLLITCSTVLIYYVPFLIIIIPSGVSLVTSFLLERLLKKHSPNLKA